MAGTFRLKFGRLHTVKKEKTNFLVYKEIQEIQMGSGAKSYMTKGFLTYEEMRKYERTLVKYDLICTRSLLNFLIYEENFLFFFYQCSSFVYMQVMTTASAPPSFVPGFMSKAGKQG